MLLPRRDFTWITLVGGEYSHHCATLAHVTRFHLNAACKRRLW